MKSKENQVLTILMAEDDVDDRFLVQEALEENNTKTEIVFVDNGEDLISYLLYKDSYAEATHQLPNLILLDLNMPKMDGREALKTIKQNSSIKSIPVVVFTTSKAPEDIKITYDLGVNSFITKPVSFADLVKVMKSLGDYWFDLVRLPQNLEEE